jgi:DNA ligase-1
MHSLMGKWQPTEASFQELISAENVNPDNSKPYPFCLAYPLEKDLEELGNPMNG